MVDRYLEGSEKLVMPDMVNILLSHNPNSFDRAAELGIDLTDGTRKPAASYTSTAASEPPAPPSASAQGRKSR